MLNLESSLLDSYESSVLRSTDIVSRTRGQKRINLQAALDAQPPASESVEMTFGELARAYLALHFNGADMQMRKWIDLLEHTNAWEVSAQQLAKAGIAMIEHGYSPSTVNRNFSQIGSVYRWAKKQQLTPAGFVSPTLSQHRYEEPIRYVYLSEEEEKRIIDGSVAAKDRRFHVLIRLLMETGARYSEIADRRWSDVDINTCSIEVLVTKGKKPRMVFFTEQTASLMRRIWPSRPLQALLFESEKAPHKVKTYTKPWNKLRQTIGRPEIRIHDLRHHRSKLLIESGTSLAIASQALGNSSLVLHRRYGHLESATLKTAMQSSWTKK